MVVVVQVFLVLAEGGFDIEVALAREALADRGEEILDRVHLHPHLRGSPTLKEHAAQQERQGLAVARDTHRVVRVDAPRAGAPTRSASATRTILSGAGAPLPKAKRL